MQFEHICKNDNYNFVLNTGEEFTLKKSIISLILFLILFTSIPSNSQERNAHLGKYQFYSKSYARLDSSLCKLEIFTNLKVVSLQGCCSWHQGVCGCQLGNAICCDGTHSSCKC